MPLAVPVVNVVITKVYFYIQRSLNEIILLNYLAKTFDIPLTKKNVDQQKFPINAIQDKGQGKKGPPTSVSPVTSTKVGVTLQIFLTCCFNLFVTLV